ncbi:hypothetical protein WJX73_001563 [Symbiochloris irregularis]|uniref:Uncharacterized protein n=1 Tax=Symbiochloris irregularis TaxID=706552 RepID=A0AAW1NYL6_9CHLO
MSVAHSASLLAHKASCALLAQFRGVSSFSERGFLQRRPQAHFRRDRPVQNTVYSSASTSARPEVQEGVQVCQDCQGKGRLERGGYHKRNPLRRKQLVGTQWTSIERQHGWRHFRVVEKRRDEKKATHVLMASTCDKEVRFWVIADDLKDRATWAAGWLQKHQLEAGPGDGAECRACKGTGQLRTGAA